MKREVPASLNEIDFKDKRVFMRVDFNVPVENGQVTDSYRIEQTLPSIRHILKEGGRLVLGSHLGRPKGVDPKLSLKPVAEYLSDKENLEVIFVEEPDSEAPYVLTPSLKENQVILLENLRFHPGEEAADIDLARQLRRHFDVYINDGFSICHRNHMSVTTLPELFDVKGMGFLIEKEIKELDYIRLNPSRPFVVILGGSKVSEKVSLLSELISKADIILVGGLVSYSFLDNKDFTVGKSYVDKSAKHQIETCLERIKELDKKLILPADHVVALPDGTDVQRTDYSHIPKGYVGMDIGEKTKKLFKEAILSSRSVFWNGPLGLFEDDKFKHGTQFVAEVIANHSTAHRVIGGGHSAKVFKDLANDINHISTGGGSSLSYLQDPNLPGIRSLLT